MDHPVPDDATVYLVFNDFGKFGKAYVETDICESDREAIIRNFISGQYSNALRVVAFNAAKDWSRDVSQDIANEVLERHETFHRPCRRHRFGESIQRRESGHENNPVNKCRWRPDHFDA
jgi:hypothetical protein